MGIVDHGLNPEPPEGSNESAVGAQVKVSTSVLPGRGGAWFYLS